MMCKYDRAAALMEQRAQSGATSLHPIEARVLAKLLAEAAQFRRDVQPLPVEFQQDRPIPLKLINGGAG